MPAAISNDPVSTSGSQEEAPSNSPSSSHANTMDDVDLQRVIETWPTLPGPVRAGIVAMVKASGGDDLGHAREESCSRRAQAEQRDD